MRRITRKDRKTRAAQRREHRSFTSIGTLGCLSRPIPLTILSELLGPARSQAADRPTGHILPLPRRRPPLHSRPQSPPLLCVWARPLPLASTAVRKPLCCPPRPSDQRGTPCRAAAPPRRRSSTGPVGYVSDRVSCIFPPRPPPALLSRATAYARLHNTLDTFRIHAYPGGTQIPQHPPLASRSQATGVRQQSRGASTGVAAAELSPPPARSAASRASVRHALARSRAHARTHIHTACCMRILSHVPAFRPRKKSCTRASTCTSTASPSQKATCSASWCRNVMLSGPP